jgi:hypothetical protein
VHDLGDVWRVVGWGALAAAAWLAFPERGEGLSKFKPRNDAFAAMGCVSFGAVLVAMFLALSMFRSSMGTDNVRFALLGGAALLFALVLRSVTSEAGQQRLMRELKWDERKLEALDHGYLGAIPVLIVLGGGFLLVIGMVMATTTAR